MRCGATTIKTIAFLGFCVGGVSSARGMDGHQFRGARIYRDMMLVSSVCRRALGCEWGGVLTGLLLRELAQLCWGGGGWHFQRTTLTDLRQESAV